MRTLRRTWTKLDRKKVEKMLVIWMLSKVEVFRLGKIFERKMLLKMFYFYHPKALLRSMGF